MKKRLLLLSLLSVLLVASSVATSPYIRRADCRIVMVDWDNPSVIPVTENYAGLMYIQPDGGYTRNEPIHFWKRDGTTYKYYSWNDFEYNTTYRLNGYIKIEGGGLIWLGNGNTYWIPCHASFLPYIKGY